MSENVVIATIAVLPGTLAAFATLVVGVRNSRRSVMRDEKIEEIHKATNGMHKALIESTAKASKAEGKEEQRADDKAATDTKQG